MTKTKITQILIIIIIIYIISNLLNKHYKEHFSCNEHAKIDWRDSYDEISNALTHEHCTRNICVNNELKSCKDIVLKTTAQYRPYTLESSQFCTTNNTECPKPQNNCTIL